MMDKISDNSARCWVHHAGLHDTIAVRTAKEALLLACCGGCLEFLRSEESTSLGCGEAATSAVLFGRQLHPHKGERKSSFDWSIIS